jgi:DNA-3-methyladenine glycosylase II
MAEVPQIKLEALIGHQRKARTVAALARAFCEVREDWLRAAPLDDVEAFLQGIKGVGEFTSGFVLFRGLGRFIRQPLSKRLTAAAARVYGREMTERDVLEKSQGYGPWAGYWSLYLWMSTLVSD